LQLFLALELRWLLKSLSVLVCYIWQIFAWLRVQRVSMLRFPLKVSI